MDVPALAGAVASAGERVGEDGAAFGAVVRSELAASGAGAVTLGRFDRAVAHQVRDGWGRTAPQGPPEGATEALRALSERYGAMDRPVGAPGAPDAPAAGSRAATLDKLTARNALDPGTARTLGTYDTPTGHGDLVIVEVDKQHAARALDDPTLGRRVGFTPGRGGASDTASGGDRIYVGVWPDGTAQAVPHSAFGVAGRDVVRPDPTFVGETHRLLGAVTDIAAPGGGALGVRGLGAAGRGAAHDRGAAAMVGDAAETVSVTANRAVKTRLGMVPQGLTREQFAEVKKIADDAAERLGGKAYVHGSRAEGTAKPTSDMDVKIVVDEAAFQRHWEAAFGTKNPGSAQWRTGQHALETGKIQTGEAKLKSVRTDLEKVSGLSKIDLSIILKGGQFDTEPAIRAAK